MQLSVSLARLGRAGSLAALSLGLWGCGSAPPKPVDPVAAAARSAAAGTPNADWDLFTGAFRDTAFELSPAWAAAMGRHEFDGRLADLSAAGLQRRIEWLESRRQRATAYPDAVLTPAQRDERDTLLAAVDNDLFWLRDAGEPWRNPAFYLFELDPTVYLSRPYAPLPQRMAAFIAWARAVPAAVAQARANLQTPLPRTFVELGVDGFGGMPAFLRKQVPVVFADVKDAAQQRELKRAIEPAAVALQGLADWLKAQRGAANDNYELGRDLYRRMLWMTEGLDATPERILAAGQADLAKNRAALEAACAGLAPKAGLKACLAKLDADKPRGGAVAGAREQLAGLKQFVQQQDLMTIPESGDARVDEAPPYRRWNFAYIDIPGPYDTALPSTYYIAPPDPKWPAAEQRDYLPDRHTLLITSAHEVWPGHFLQSLHVRRAPSELSRLYGSYAYGEGWAHYTEQLVVEAGLQGATPALRAAQAREALLRDVRLLCSIGLHTQGMTLKACERMFREQAFQDAGTARQQAARATFDPAYLGYTLGKLMILKLRDDWTASRGGRAAWKAFHDQFLAQGPGPIPLVRRRMLGEGAGDALPAP